MTRMYTKEEVSAIVRTRVYKLNRRNAVLEDENEILRHLVDSLDTLKILDTKTKESEREHGEDSTKE